MSFKKLFFLFFLIIASSTVVPVLGNNSVTLTSKNGRNEVFLTISSVYYTNLDNDTILDVVALYDLFFDSSNRHTVRLDVYLTLPSGYKLSYMWIIGTKQQEFSSQIRLYDCVLESGDYLFTIKAKLLTGGVSTGIADYIFDPPGGSGGGNPL